MWFWLIIGIATVIVSIHAIITKKFADDPVPLWQPEWLKKRMEKLTYYKAEGGYYHWQGTTAVVFGYIFLILGILFTLYIAHQMFFIEN